MNRTFFYIALCIAALSSCTKQPTFQLQAEITGLQSDTVLVYYQEPYYKLDTLVANQGKFLYTPSIDTLTIFSLLLDGEEIVPIFANKGTTVSLSGSKEGVEIVGEGDNALMNQLFTALRSHNQHPDSLRSFAKSYIEANPFSYTTLYLLERFFFEQEEPNSDEIRNLIQGLGGNVEDTYHAMVMQGKLGDRNIQRSEMLYTLRCKGKDGKELGLNQLKRGYTLLYFWASWDAPSLALQDSLARVHKALLKEDFNLYGFSLDMNKEEWLSALPTDTTRWKQGCNFTGWSDDLLKQQRITRLPATILLGPDKRIRGRNVVGDSLITLVKESIATDKKREKAQAARTKARELKNR